MDMRSVFSSQPRRHQRALTICIALLALLTSHNALALSEVTGFGSNPGNLKMFKYVPSGLPAAAPLVVALHGCAQSAASYDNETGWQALADQWKFALLLPQQQSANNSSSCFNWFESGDIARGSGEALSIRQMVDRMKSDHASDGSRVFVTGLSAGGAMTAVLLATYPDVFAGGGIIAGVPYNCGTGTSAAFSCMNPGSDLTPAQWGNKVRAASTHSGPWPRVSIWHGASDSTVRPVNATESMEQWTNVHGIDQIADVSDTIAGYPHKVYRNAAGADLVETMLITGMGHGTPVDPGTGPTQCGTAGAYILDVNVCSSYYIGRFWGLDNLDSTPPSVSITAPTQGATVTGAVSITASATDAVGVDRVEFLVDGALLAADNAAPYSVSWNAAAAANGAHNLQARAFDLAGNSASSTAINVTVSGGVSDTTAPTVQLVFPTAGATVSGTITLAADANDDFAVSSVVFLVDGVVIGNGNPPGQAGPWTYDWNSTGVANGAHNISARAIDSSGNQTTSPASAITVTQNPAAVDETFSNRNADGDYFDQVGWSGDFSANALNHSVGIAGSQSSYGAASSGVGCASGLKTRYLQRSITLGANPRLSYQRRLDLKANINSSTTAWFRVKLNSTVVDEKLVTFANYADSDWVAREEIDLSTFANQTITLRFEAAANTTVCLEAWARAYVDDIRIANAEQSLDITPPGVNLTAPANGATVSGSVELQASASDASGVSKVEFYANGSLLHSDSAAPFTHTWDTSAVENGSYALMAKAYDPAGNVGSDDDTQVNVSNGGGGGPITVVFDNEDANDGYVKAASNGSGAAVGTLESSMGLAIGRGSDSKFNRSVLSFDSSALPDGATIVSAVLTVSYRSASGDPWASPANNTLVVDVKNGCYGGCTIETGDFLSAASASAVAEIMKFTSGNQNSSTFSSAGLQAINRAGRTQIRLRFSADQTSTRYVWIDRGASAKLTVQYLP